MQSDEGKVLSFLKCFSFSINGGIAAKSNPLEPRSPLQTFKHSFLYNANADRTPCFLDPKNPSNKVEEWQRNGQLTASHMPEMMQHRVKIHKNAQIKRRLSCFNVSTVDVTAGSFRKRAIPANINLNVKLKAHKSFLKDH